MPAVNSNRYHKPPRRTIIDPATVICESCGADLKNDGAIYCWAHGTPASGRRFFGRLRIVNVHQRPKGAPFLVSKQQAAWRGLHGEIQYELCDRLLPDFRVWRLNRRRTHNTLYCSMCHEEVMTTIYHIHERTQTCPVSTLLGMSAPQKASASAATAVPTSPARTPSTRTATPART